VPSRRHVLRTGLTLGGFALTAGAARLFDHVAAQTLCPSAGPLGELLGTVPFIGSRPHEAPFGRIVGGPGLDARMFTDLSDLDAGRVITPTSRVFIRTAAPPDLARRLDRWTIDVEGLAKPATITRGDLLKAARPMGAHLIECAGNTDPQNFGLMSVAEWDGVPLGEVIGRLRTSPGAFAVKVTGLDHDTQYSPQSIPGASWIFPLDTLSHLGAFLAVRMNGEPLPPDHGAPVRLVVPGWYGCAWIKWVNELRVVGRDEPATSQMREFAGRTHQNGVPELAREYSAAAIDMAATPVRIEKRRVDGRIQYRVIGIVWGGDRTTDRLLIRFSANDELRELQLCPAPRTHRTWSLWEYRWRPARTGVYDIVLRAADRSIRTQRLDLSFYVRRVRIDEV